MRDGRHLAALLVVLGALALAVPAVALAGGSAGNNQYTNPFGGGTTSQPATTPQTSSTAAPQTTTATPPPATADSPGTTESPATATSVVTTSEPTATAAASAGAGTTTGGKALPRTGYAIMEIAGFGLVMLAAGFVIRRRGRRA